MTNKLEPTFEGDFTFAEDAPFRLAGGGSLRPVTQRYAIYGHLSPARDNAILVCHALSGSARVFDWWPQLFGPGKPFDISRHAILGVNVLGSCYGSTGPKSVNPATGQPYRGDFPVVTIHDMVHAQARLLDHLGIDRLHAVVGGSIGGMQALAWATLYPARVSRCVVVGACPVNAMGLALGHLQRQAIRLDPVGGLALARGMAMLTYKSPELFDQRFARKPDRSGDHPLASHDGRFDIGGYLDYQGRIFLARFDPYSYLVVSRAMDLFELGATPEEEARALANVRARVVLVGIRSDWLFPPGDVRSLAERLVAAGAEARYVELDSAHGHDGFLADAADLIPLISPALFS
jgi:homoserine O-acetyltransferase